VEKGVALIRLVNSREESICIKTTKPDVDEHCITFDSDSFPNFFTVEHCQGPVIKYWPLTLKFDLDFDL